MKKVIYIFALVLMILMSTTSNASAWILAKLSNMAEDVTTAMTKFGQQAQNSLDQVATLTIVQKIGKGFKEAKEWTESQVSKVKSFSDEVQGDIAAYQKMYEDTKKIYDDTLGDYTKILDDVKKLEQSQQEIMAKIQEDKTSIETKIAAQKSVISGQMKSCTDNMSNLKKMMLEDPTNKEAYEKEYNQLAEQQKELSSQISNIDDLAQQEIDSIVNSYNSELSNIKSQLAQLKADLSQLAGFSDESQSNEDMLLNTANMYFLQYDEPLSPSRQDTIRSNRLRERRESIVAGYSQSIAKIPDYVAKDNEAEDLGYNASTFDTTAGAWGAAAQLQIDNLKALSTYAHLLIYDLKRQTAVEMSNLTFYKLQKEQKNISEFNLDDYVYKKKGDK